MRLLLLLPLLYFTACSNSQIVSPAVKQNDSLKKYSYLTYYFSDTGKVESLTATGFFLRSKKGIYFITASHNYNNCDDNMKKIEYYPDVMNICNSNGSSTSIEIKKIKDTSSCNTFFEKPDITAIKVGEVNRNKYYEEYLLQDSINVQRIDTIVIYSFPRKDFYKIDKSQSPTPLGISNFTIYDKVKFKGKLDTFNYWVDNPAITYDDTFKGSSGAPVFGKNKTDNTWILLGIWVGYLRNDDNNRGYMIICRPRTIRQHLNSIY